MAITLSVQWPDQLAVYKYRRGYYDDQTTCPYRRQWCGAARISLDDTWSTAAAALMAEGADSWFFITADYAFGHAFENDTTDFVKQGGGKVLGSVAFPFSGNI
jgi:ABC-type branched-subunit amino acid transport system substrate-binding protein